jgi:transposase InsO family protein
MLTACKGGQHVLAGAVNDVAENRVCGAGVATRRQSQSVVPAVWDQPDHGIPAVGSLRRRGGGGVGAAIEAEVVAVRDAHPTWGGRKLAKVLARRGVRQVPAASTCPDLLRRHDRLAPPETQPRPWQRFAHGAANDLWPLDCKGHVPLAVGRCHPLSVLDDHARFLVGLAACANEQDETVRVILTDLFRRYGMPWRLLVDNGPPWGNPHPVPRETRLRSWLLRLGIDGIHGRPRHPQTQGKVARVQRTLIGEVLATTPLPNLASAHRAFAGWRDISNQERPHDAVDLATPLSRDQVAPPREFPAALPPIDYGPGAIVKTVHGKGQLTDRGHCLYVSAALVGEPVAVRPTTADGIFERSDCHCRLGQLNAHTRTYRHAYAAEDKEQHRVRHTV